MADGAGPAPLDLERSHHADQPLPRRRVVIGLRPTGASKGIGAGIGELNPGGGAVIEVGRGVGDEIAITRPKDDFTVGEGQHPGVHQQGVLSPQAERACHGEGPREKAAIFGGQRHPGGNPNPPIHGGSKCGAGGAPGAIGVTTHQRFQRNIGRDRDRCLLGEQGGETADAGLRLQQRGIQPADIPGRPLTLAGHHPGDQVTGDPLLHQLEPQQRP